MAKNDWIIWIIGIVIVLFILNYLKVIDLSSFLNFFSSSPLGPSSVPASGGGLQ